MNLQKGDAPFIMTAALPPDMASWATALRREYFPPERNFLDAHVTLFHALPPSCEDELCDLLAELVKRHSAPAGRLEGLMSLGRGTALRLSSQELLNIRRDIADHFHGSLSPQDSHHPRLHVTIQNKVSPAEAKALQARLDDQIAPRAIAFPALELHIYRGGPWEFVKRWPFRGNTAA
ncbi:2'-5' RNA ligase family protein [Altererythrobacter aquiaggeris]|uniref:2'-5' RNA ligase family protein n=1 Tax=Aestuarierythrobacter aquiaggeris TaxID=1898396 RepID=UPI0030191CD7